MPAWLPLRPICQTYVFILINNVDSASLELPHHREVRPHGRSDKDVIKAISVNVTGSDGVAKICPDLIARQIV